MVDDEAIARNENLKSFEVKEDGSDVQTQAGVILLQDAYLASAPNRIFSHAIIVPQHAALEMEFTCRSQVGFGFAVKPTGDTKTLDGESEIVSRLYGVAAPDAQGFRHEVVRRFQGGARRLFVADPVTDVVGHSVSIADASQRWELEAIAWDLERYIDPVTSRVYDASTHRRDPISGSQTGSGGHPSVTSKILEGDHFLAMSNASSSVEQVKPGVLVGRDRSNQSFGQIKVLKEGASLGQIKLTIFVI